MSDRYSIGHTNPGEVAFLQGEIAELEGRCAILTMDNLRLRTALKQIVACDFRGNMPPEQAIARAALEGGTTDGEPE